MTHDEGYIEVAHSQARGSSKLYWQRWLPDDELRAVVLLVHGLGEHSSRYNHLAGHCVARGIGVYAVDHYGHGKSDGHPGYVERFSVYLDGVDAVLDMLQSEHTGRPVFLLGHSMGGLIAARFLLERQDEFRACVLSGLLLKTDAAPPALLLALNRLLSLLLPTLPMVRLDATAISRDPEVVNTYVTDPLVFHGKLSSRLIAEMTAAMHDTLARASEIHIPLILMHGEQDALTSPSGSVEMYEQLASADKTIKLYAGLYHEIFNEPERDDVLTDMSSWLEAHLA